MSASDLEGCKVGPRTCSSTCMTAAFYLTLLSTGRSTVGPEVGDRLSGARSHQP